MPLANYVDDKSLALSETSHSIHASLTDLSHFLATFYKKEYNVREDKLHLQLNETRGGFGIYFQITH